MNDLHFVRRARLRMCCLGAVILFAGAALMFLLAIPAGSPARTVLVSAGGMMLLGLVAALLEAQVVIRQLEREDVENDQAQTWDKTKADLAELQSRRGRT